jgi:serine/threonine protein kinase
MTSVGTLLYMAPEVGEDHYDCKVDVYSFGLIMYEIVTSDPIFSGASDNKLELLRELPNGWRPEVRNVKPVSRSIIERNWSMNAEERPPFQDILRELYDGGFDIIPGITNIDVIGLGGWTEACGGEMN